MGPTLSQLVDDLNNEQNFITRAQAITHLSESTFPERHDLLLASLQDPYFKVREKAAQALGKAQTPEVIPHLVAATTDIPSVRDAALEALNNRTLPDQIRSKISSYQDSYSMYTRRQALKKKLAFDNKEPDMIHMALDDPDFLVREAAVERLSTIHTSESLSALTRAANDLYISVRELALRAIQAYEGPLTASFFQEELKTTNWTLFYALVSLMVSRSFTKAGDLLVTLLQHENYAIRRRARAGLAGIEPGNSLPALIDSLALWDSQEMAVPAYTIAQLYREGNYKRVSYFSEAMEGLMGNIVEKDWPKGIDALNKLALEGEWRHLAFFSTADLDRRNQFNIGAVLDRTFALQKQHTSTYLCIQHLARFSSYTYNGNNFLACRICEHTHTSIRVSNVFAVLDSRMTEPVLHQGEFYRVNWLQSRSRMDFDAIEIGDCPEEFITDFCIDTGNDTDAYRIQIYKNVPCYIQEGIRLSTETLNMLRNQFNQVIQL